MTPSSSKATSSTRCRSRTSAPLAAACRSRRWSNVARGTCQVCGARTSGRDGEVGVAFDAAVARHERRAPLLRKARLPDQIVGADRVEHVVDRRQQRLADVEAREPIALEEDDPMSRSREPGGRRRTGGAAAGDDHVAVEGHGPLVCHRTRTILAGYTELALG